MVTTAAPAHTITKMRLKRRLPSPADSTDSKTARLMHTKRGPHRSQSRNAADRADALTPGSITSDSRRPTSRTSRRMVSETGSSMVLFGSGGGGGAAKSEGSARSISDMVKSGRRAVAGGGA